MPGVAIINITSVSIIGTIINTIGSISGGLVSAVFVDYGSRCLFYAARNVELK